MWKLITATRSYQDPQCRPNQHQTVQGKFAKYNGFIIPLAIASTIKGK